MTWTGSGTAGHKVTHGLGSVPKLIIMKRRDSTDSWPVYHHKNTAAPETDYLHLNESIATVDSVDRWNDTAPTSTLITLGDAGAGNADGGTYVGYCWDEVQGYSKFGGYLGNGDADGPFVYTGFKPAFVIIKAAQATGDWVIYDSQRSPYNEIDDQLLVNEATAETTGSEEIDFLSNGFKIRTDDGNVNTSAGSYVYLAFAEYPFGGDGATPSTTF